MCAYLHTFSEQKSELEEAPSLKEDMLWKTNSPKSQMFSLVVSDLKASYQSNVYL